MMENLLPGGLGLATGLLLGLTGAGGGIMAAPLLILVMHQSVTSAAPIALVAVSLGAGLGMLMGLREGIVRYRAALILSTTGLLASPLGIYFSRILPNTPLMLAFALLLGYQGWRYWRGGGLARDRDLPCVLDPQSGRFVWNALCTRVMLTTGLMAGFLSGLLGVGGGFILVPALRRHTPLSMHAIAATSLMVLTVVSTGGLLQWLALGDIQWRIAVPFVAGVLVGMFAGRRGARRMREDHVRRLFAVLCFAVCASLLIKIGVLP